MRSDIETRYWLHESTLLGKRWQQMPRSSVSIVEVCISCCPFDRWWWKWLTEANWHIIPNTKIDLSASSSELLQLITEIHIFCFESRNFSSLSLRSKQIMLQSMNIYCCQCRYHTSSQKLIIFSSFASCAGFGSRWLRLGSPSIFAVLQLATDLHGGHVFLWKVEENVWCTIEYISLEYSVSDSTVLFLLFVRGDWLSSGQNIVLTRIGIIFTMASCWSMVLTILWTWCSLPPSFPQLIGRFTSDSFMNYLEEHIIWIEPRSVLCQSRRMNSYVECWVAAAIWWYWRNVVRMVRISSRTIDCSQSCGARTDQTERADIWQGRSCCNFSQCCNRSKLNPWSSFG